MQHPYPLDTGTTAGTLGGTFTCILCSQHLESVVHTIFMAALGAIVSFAVSLSLKYVLTRLKR